MVSYVWAAKGTLYQNSATVATLIRTHIWHSAIPEVAFTWKQQDRCVFTCSRRTVWTKYFFSICYYVPPCCSHPWNVTTSSLHEAYWRRTEVTGAEDNPIECVRGEYFPVKRIVQGLHHAFGSDWILKSKWASSCFTWSYRVRKSQISFRSSLNPITNTLSGPT